MNRDHSVVSETASNYCISDSFVDYDGYSMSSKGCSRWSSELNSPTPVHFSSLIPKMSMFTLAISCLIISNMTWFMGLTFQVPMQYCSLQHWILLPLPVTSTTECCCFGSISSFFLELFLHWSPIAYWTPTDLGSSKRGSQGYTTEVVCCSLLQWTMFCQNSPPWPVCLGWPYMAWLIVSLS